METDLVRIWQEVCGIIKKELTEVSYRTWIEPIKPVSIDINRIDLCARSDFEREIIKVRYLQLLKSALKLVTSREFEIEVMTSSNTGMQKDSISYEKGIKHEFTLNSSYRFENYIIGDSNILAYKAAVNIAGGNIKTFNPLYIYGDAGLGKTHLLQAIGHYTAEHNPEYKFLYISIEEFTNELISSIMHDNENMFLEKYLQLDLLLIDNFQFIEGKERTQEEFFRVYNKLIAANKRIAIASKKSPQRLKFFDNSLSSSVDIGLITEIKTPDFETRVSILKKLGDIEDIVIPDEVAEYIAEKVMLNGRELKNALNKVISYSVLLNEELKLETALNALS